MSLCRAEKTHSEESTSTITWSMHSNKKLHMDFIEHMVPNANPISPNFDEFPGSKPDRLIEAKVSSICQIYLTTMRTTFYVGDENSKILVQ